VVGQGRAVDRYGHGGGDDRDGDEDPDRPLDEDVRVAAEVVIAGQW